ncbi:uracil-DNA glycosylase [Prosthecomicrobium sp. N25]|uniref:uracil-DNA glycosylase n=1 Tax=Prosthecomicrobium sp. N25 TaxID=3129254 RepID=UPI003077593E
MNPAADPPRDCPICPRLAAFRSHWAEREPAWHNAPVPLFGDPGARLLIVGLAPGLRGANRTGRPFTGDYAGDLLYATLLDFGWATGTYRASPDDGIALVGAAIVNAVRCVPPENKPTPQEIGNCRPYLSAAIAGLPALDRILALGRIAHDSVVRAFGLPASRLPFGHGAVHRLSDRITLHDSYHCSRYNTNTGVLTEPMFRAVFEGLRKGT